MQLHHQLSLNQKAKNSVESLTARFSRRLVTVPLATVCGVLWIGLSPIWIPLALLADLFRPSPRVVTRFGLCLVVYFIMVFFGLIGCLLFFFLRIIHIIPNQERYRQAHYALQYWWGQGLLKGTFSLLKLRLVVEGEEHLRSGPVLVFMRHVTLLDTLLPAAAFGQSRSLHLRYLLKKELLVEPCLDICGNRIPNLFVDRSGKQRDTMLQDVETLASGLGDMDGVILYPEGTRFTLGKRRRLIEKLSEAGDPKHLAQAQALQNLLPVRQGGPASCFKAAPKADVLIVGHVGLEGAANLPNFLSGRVFDTTVRVKIWRIPQSELPESVDDRGDWLVQRWEELDDWIQRVSDNDTVGQSSATDGANHSA